MRLLTAIAALAGAVGTALAQTADFDAITRPGMNEEVPAGKTYTVTWNVADKYANQQVTIGLLGGDTGATLHPLGTLGTADGSAGSFNWAVDSSLGTQKTYGLVIALSSDSSIFQYSTPFSITGGSTVQSVGSSSSPQPTSTKQSSTSTSEPTTTHKSSSSTEKTTSIPSTTTSSESSSTIESNSSKSSKSSSTTTTFMTVTASPSGGDGSSGTSTTAQTSASATSQPSDEKNGGGGAFGLSTGALVGIGCGGLAGILLVIAIISKAVKMKRSRENDRYQDIDGQY